MLSMRISPDNVEGLDLIHMGTRNCALREWSPKGGLFLRVDTKRLKLNSCYDNVGY